jgi:serine/threonine protein phosphatase PrpC
VEQTLESDHSILLIKAAKLLPYAKKARTLQGFATAYEYEPESNEASFGLGHLLAVVEVLSTTKQAEEVVDLIIKTVGESFYNHADIDQDTYSRFAQAIKSVNRELANYAEHGKAGWIGRLSAILALQADNELHVTHAGSAAAFLYRGGTSNLITPPSAEQGPSRPANSFSSIASGQLQPLDRLLLATPALYHQVDKLTLHQAVSESSPELAIEKLSAIVNQTSEANRVAAIVAELATAKQLASQRGAVTPGSLELKVGRPDNLIESARQTAAPLVSSSLKSAHGLARTALKHSKSQLLPWLRSVALRFTQLLRQALRNRRHRRIIALIALALAASMVIVVYRSTNAKAINQLVDRYDTAFAGFQAATAQANFGDKDAAKQKLQQADKELADLAGMAQSKLLPTRLTNRPHPEDDPASINDLRAKIKLLLDKLEGLTSVATEDVMKLQDLDGQPPGHLEILGNKLVMISSDDGSIYTYDLTSRQLLTVALKPAGVGKIVASTAASDNEGVYILTDAPAVWYFNGTSLAKQTPGFGDWPKGSDIASYAGNLYILAHDNSQIFKHLRTIGGFSGRTGYLIGSASELSESKTMAIDGNIYTAGPFGIKRFLAGKLDHSLPLPDSLSKSHQIVSFASGNRLLVLDNTNGRLGVISTDGPIPTLLQQLLLIGAPKIVDAKADATGRTIFVLTPNKVSKLTLPQ